MTTSAATDCHVWHMQGANSRLGCITVGWRGPGMCAPRCRSHTHRCRPDVHARQRLSQVWEYDGRPGSSHCATRPVLRWPSCHSSICTIRDLSLTLSRSYGTSTCCCFHCSGFSNWLIAIYLSTLNWLIIVHTGLVMTKLCKFIKTQPLSCWPWVSESSWKKFFFQAWENSWKPNWVLKVLKFDVRQSWKLLNFSCSESSWLKSNFFRMMPETSNMTWQILWEWVCKRQSLSSWIFLPKTGCTAYYIPSYCWWLLAVNWI